MKTQALSALCRGEKSRRVFFIARGGSNRIEMGKDMAEQPLRNQIATSSGETCTLKFLELHQVSMVDEALNSVGDFGEVRLIVERGRLRFLVTQKSFDALKWQPGLLSE